MSVFKMLAGLSMMVKSLLLGGAGLEAPKPTPQPTKAITQPLPTLTPAPKAKAKPLPTAKPKQWLKGGVAGALTGPKSGIAKHYYQGIMEKVMRNRGIKPRGDVNGYAATTDCNAIGKVVLARLGNGPVERFLVVDCSAPWDISRHLAEGLVIEVDYQTATRYPGLLESGRIKASLLGIER